MVVETGPFVSSHHRPWISTMTVGVRGTLTKFKRRRGVAKSVNVSRFKIGQNLSIPTSLCQVPAALLVKRSAGQINLIVHAVGILVALPKILEPGELVQSLSLGAGNTGRAHDLETDRRIDEFRAGRDGAALSQRARR